MSFGESLYSNRKMTKIYQIYNQIGSDAQFAQLDTDLIHKIEQKLEKHIQIHVLHCLNSLNIKTNILLLKNSIRYEDIYFHFRFQKLKRILFVYPFVVDSILNSTENVRSSTNGNLAIIVLDQCIYRKTKRMKHFPFSKLYI